MARTPWGTSQVESRIVPGYIEYSTASHGGVYLSPERQEMLPAWARIDTCLGTLQWWDEDSEMCVPFLAFVDEIRSNPKRRAAHEDWDRIVGKYLEYALLVTKSNYPTVYAGYIASRPI